MAHDFELDGYSAKVDRRRRLIRAPDFIELAFALAGLFLLGRLLLPAWNCWNWEAARRAQCTNNLKQIALALHAYHERYGSLPPAFIADASGRPLHSWRVLILPFLDQSALHDQYDFSQPWDSPDNVKLLGKMPQVFACPSRFPAPRDVTSYVVITGPGTMFPGTGTVKFPKVTDGTNDTLMVAETANVDIPWTAPADLDLRTMSSRLNDPDHPGISSKHPGGAGIVCGDGQAYFVKDRVDARRLRSLITIAGADGYPYDDGSPSF